LEIKESRRQFLSTDIRNAINLTGVTEMEQTEGPHSTKANRGPMIATADSRARSSSCKANGFNFEEASSCRY
jgi:hypothetical protein